jgi:hypothetical protein
LNFQLCPQSNHPAIFHIQLHKMSARHEASGASDSLDKGKGKGKASDMHEDVTMGEDDDSEEDDDEVDEVSPPARAPLGSLCPQSHSPQR